jgi:hypothetical protein
MIKSTREFVESRTGQICVAIAAIAKLSYAPKEYDKLWMLAVKWFLWAPSCLS